MNRDWCCDFCGNPTNLLRRISRTLAICPTCYRETAAKPNDPVRLAFGRWLYEHGRITG